MKSLLKVQAELKCPKGSFNSFGKYKYRSAEQILESLKPHLLANELMLFLTDEIVAVGDKLFLKATASVWDAKGANVQTNGFAELGEHKGMSSEQCNETESDPDSKDNSKTEKKLPAIDQKRFSAAVQAIAKGEFTREKLESSFALTEGQIDMLNAL